MLYFLVCTVSKRAKAKKVMGRMGLGDRQEGARGAHSGARGAHSGASRAHSGARGQTGGIVGEHTDLVSSPVRWGRFY